MSQTRGVRDRDVLVVMAGVVVVVLVAIVLSTFVPGIGRLFQALPILVIGLVVGTAYVLYRSLRPR